MSISTFSEDYSTSEFIIDLFELTAIGSLLLYIAVVAFQNRPLQPRDDRNNKNNKIIAAERLRMLM